MMTKNSKQALNRPVDHPPQGLYVHWPFCVSKCPYCDFNSHVSRVFSEVEYVRAVCRELDHMRALAASNAVGSVFFGGGTPSLMEPASVAAILEHVAARFDLREGAEISLEANPSSVEAARFEALAAAGVNRLSLGVQALDDEALRVLGRAHGRGEAIKAIELAQKWFPRMSFDMIYGRHGQTHAEWRKELREILSFKARHLSLYQLTIEEGTRYHTLYEQHRLDLPSGKMARAFFETTREVCAGAGLSPYEISNFASEGEASRHNLAYWRYHGYLGVGPGAHGRIVTKKGRLASSTWRSPRRWLQQIRRGGHGLEVLEELDVRAQATEMLLMGLRLREGVDLARLKRLTGHGFDKQGLAELVGLGLCAHDENRHRLRATGEGMLVLNTLIEKLSEYLVRSGR